MLCTTSLIPIKRCDFYANWPCKWFWKEADLALKVHPWLVDLSSNIAILFLLLQGRGQIVDIHLMKPIVWILKSVYPIIYMCKNWRGWSWRRTDIKPLSLQSKKESLLPKCGPLLSQSSCVGFIMITKTKQKKISSAVFLGYLMQMNKPRRISFYFFTFTVYT